MTSSGFQNATSRQIPVRVPTRLVEELDKTARNLRRSRADIIRRLAIEHYREEYDDLVVAVERIRDSNDKVLDWDHVRRDILG